MTKENTKELCLAMLFLTGWEEESRGGKIFRAWKGYLFELLNALAEEKFIIQFANTKSVTLTDAGVERAKQILAELFPEKKKKSA